MKDSILELEEHLLTIERLLRRNHNSKMLLEFLEYDVDRCKELLADIKTFI
mgnify:CR=1 FL=1